VVSKAFQILSDPQKRSIYDQSGGDPDSRFGGASSGMAQTFAGQQFEGEISPEELFNMFFGGGLGGNMGPFGGGFGGGPSKFFELAMFDLVATHPLTSFHCFVWSWRFPNNASEG
jgi:DnaJ-class molecular chaperone